MISMWTASSDLDYYEALNPAPEEEPEPEDELPEEPEYAMPDLWLADLAEERPARAGRIVPEPARLRPSGYQAAPDAERKPVQAEHRAQRHNQKEGAI